MKVRHVHLGSMIIMVLCLVLNPVIVNANVSVQTNPSETVPAVSTAAETPTGDLPTEILPTETPVTSTATPTPTEVVKSPTPTTAVSEEPANPDEIKNGETADDSEIELLIIDSPPHPPAGFEESAVQLPEPDIEAGINTLSVPAYDWVYGCSAVSGAMIAAYYDRNGYPNLYTGPTNSGVAPMDSSSWGSFSDGDETYPLNPIIASRNGLDGRTSRGSIDNYWNYYGSTSDPYVTNGWPQHTWTTIGDYMKTSQAAYENSDGSTSFYNYTSSSLQLTCDELEDAGYTRDGNFGRSQFYKAMGYTVEQCYNQRTDNKISGAFSFNDFKAQIDNGDPVMIHVVGHTMVGVGYDDSSNTIYLHDTWDYSTHSMTWGGSYYGMEMNSVSILTLASSSPPAAPTLISPSGTITNPTPQFVWYVSPGATGYTLSVAKSDLSYTYSSNAAPSCNSTTCWITPSLNLTGGDYWFQVAAGNAAGWGSDSSKMNFTVSADPPAAPTLISPNGTVTTSSPLFVWYATANATAYWLTVVNSGGTYVYNSAITPSCNGYTCWITPSLNLSSGSYWFKVTAGNSFGWGSASSAMNFTVSVNVPAAPTLIIPNTTVAASSPFFVWYASPGATAYWLTIVRSSDGAYVYNSYVNPSSNGHTCWMVFPGSLANGNYWYKITAGNSSGWGSASSARNFAISVGSSSPLEVKQYGEEVTPLK